MIGSFPEVDPTVKGITAHKDFKMMGIDDFSAEYITSKALATRQTPEEVIFELIQEKIIFPGNTRQ